jgi:eukaryotic-like serine/threonine-protein kinase
MDPVTHTPPTERVIAGRYRLLSLVGHGAMGTVWRAYDEYLRRPVAVKEVLLPPGMPKGPADELRERTMREARAIAVLSHPNVVTVHDIAQENGDPYVVMEYVPGSSLAHLLRTHGPLDVTQAAAVADAVAAALQAAHQAGITHRDVKPGNVLVAEDGRIKLADFGIARNISEHTLTSTGITLGSPAYIAPEVASGGEVTNAADLWSLGATLFAAVEGRAPYDPEGDVMSTLLEVVNGAVPQPTTTGPMRELITGLMVKDTAGRMSLAELRRRIYPLLPEPGVSAFTTQAIADAEHRSADLPTRITASAPPSQSQFSSQPSLARDPGPLPFAPAPMPVRQQRKAPRALIYTAAVLVFLGAASGGFALARKANGQPLLPPAPVTSSQPVVVPPPDQHSSELVTRKGVATSGKQGGAFTVKVPQDWVAFVEERTAKTLPSSTRVHYVSPDGKYELIVERFADYYSTSHVFADYELSLRATWPANGAYIDSPPVPTTAPIPVQGEQALRLKYKTVDFNELRRTTFANVMPAAPDFWVLSLTVPTVEEDTGEEKLFNQIAPSFALG